jgi:hypothetical protein
MIINHKIIILHIILYSILFSNDSLIGNKKKMEPFYEYKQNKNYKMKKIIKSNAPIIDGNLNDLIWDESTSIEDFIQQDPNIFSDPTFKTDVKLLYDNENIYIYAKLYYDDINTLNKAVCRRDSWMQCFEKSSDWFVFDVDTDHSHNNGYVFGVNAAGVQIDALILNDLDYDSSWDGIWKSKILIDDQSLNIEFKIPIFNFSNFNDEEWGVNFTRYIKSIDETSSWVVIPNYIESVSSKFGHIYNLKFDNISKKLFFRPYISSAKHKINNILLESDNPQLFSEERINNLKLFSGFDFKYKLFNNTFLSSTVNPDFGQVELDPEEINLTAYESFYAENRDFFLDNSSIFDLPVQLFYSRRIGENDNLLMASKIISKTKNNTVFGNIFAIESDRLININRIEKEYFNDSSFAGLTSTVLTKNDTVIKTASMDAVLNLFDNKISIDGQFILSDNSEAIGKGLSLESQYASPYLKYFLDLEYFDEQLDIDDLGYLNRNNYKSITNGIILRDLNSSNYFRSKSISVKNIYQENIGGIKLKNSLELEGHITLINYLNFSFGNIYLQDYFDDYLTYDFGTNDFGPIIKMPSSNNFSLKFNTNPLKKIYLEAEYSQFSRINHLWDRKDKNKIYDLNLVIKPLNFITSSINYKTYLFDESLYFIETITDEETDNNHYIFSQRNGFRDIFSIRLDASLNLKSSLQFYAEYFSNNFNFSDYRVMHQDDSSFPISDNEFFNGNNDYNALYFNSEDINPTASYLDPNDHPLFHSNYNNLNMNFIFKWEYVTGSNMYLIWTYQKGVNGERFKNIDDLIKYNNQEKHNEIYENNTFLLKIDYWFNI